MTGSPLRPITICADDYGLAPGVSRGIAALIEQGRLSATSVMVVGPDFARAAPALKDLRRSAAIGLHLTLTDREALAPGRHVSRDGRMPPLGIVIRRAVTRRLDRQSITEEVLRQLDRFRTATGADPDFIDGHQHVHLLPVIRDALFAVVERELPHRRSWLRDCAEPWSRIRARGVAPVKCGVIAALARGFGSQARARGFATNEGFAGIYDFAPQPPFRTLMRRFLITAGARPLVMVHPGHSDEALAALDPVTTARDAEWAYLASTDFPADLTAAGFVLNAGEGVAKGD